MRFDRIAGLSFALLAVAGCGFGGKKSASDGTGTNPGTPGVDFVVKVSRPVGGTITSGDGKIDCGTVVGEHDLCAATFAWSQKVTLTATPDSQYYFVSWAGDCLDTDACVIDMAVSPGADKWVVAVFNTLDRIGHGNWMDPRRHAAGYYRFLAGKPDAPKCVYCHGFDYQGVSIAPSCNRCHEEAGWANWQRNCTFCHGTATKAGEPAPALAVPPDDVNARLTGAPSGAAVGAHAIHLAGSSLSSPIACGECHVVPAAPATAGSSDIATVAAHVNGVADVRFGALAGGSFAAWNATSLRCSTYCHGSTNPSWGGGVTTPAWTQTDGTARQCGSCHGVPSSKPGHPAGTDCNVCHPGYTGTSVVAATHVNGVVDVVGQGCGSCHGLPPAQYGVLVARAGGVGAHPSSTNCSVCHPTYDAADPFASSTHADHVVQVKYTPDSCVLCHTAGLPPPAPHPALTNCDKCHPGNSLTGGVAATHNDGVLNVIPMTCTTCHGVGDPAVLANAAPPPSVQGLTLTTDLPVGAHVAHLAGRVAGGAGVVLSGPLPCASCHVVPNTATPDATSHIDGGRATVTLATGSYDKVATTCSTYCHGSALDGGVNKTPAWTTQLSGGSCDACHGAPPATRGHVGLPSADLTTCVRCHSGTVDDTGAIIVSGGASLHVNGVVDEGVSTATADCTSCHTGLEGMLASTQTYHHVSDGCTGCHATHPAFTASRGYNLQPVANGVGSSTDLTACGACHTVAKSKNYAGQKDDGTRETYAIDATAYAGGGHGYAVAGSISGTGASYDFQVSCGKCHDSTTATLYQDGTYGFGTHESTDRRLRAALGRTTVGDDVAEDFCYRCHSNATDAVGGVKKGSDLADWYGATTMPPGSTGIYTQMVGTPALGQTSTDTLYFKPTAQETVSGTAPAGGSAEVTGSMVTNTLYLTSAAFSGGPAGYLQTSTTCTTQPCYDTTVLRQNAMSLTSTSSATSVTVNTAPSSGARYDRLAQFLSPPVATAFTWSSGSLSLNLWRSENNTNNNCFFRYSAYKWSGGTATQIVASANGTSEFPTTAANGSQSMSLSGAVTFNPGDQILVEVEVYKSTPTNAGTCTVAWGNTGTDGGRLVLPATSTGTFPEFQGTAPALGGSWSLRSMSPFTATTANEALTGNGTASAYATQIFQRASFVSPAVATPTTLPAAPWTLNVYANRGSLSSSTAYLRYRIYRWTAGGAQGEDIVGWRTSSSALQSSTSLVAITTPAGAPVSLSAGDKVVVELEVETMNTTASATASSQIVFGSSSNSAAVLPAKVVFGYTTPAVVSTVGHLGQAYTGIHRPNPAEETLARIGAAKHVECSDCHDPHQARRGNQADGGTASSATSTSLTDVNQKWLADAWKGFYVDIVSGTGAGGRAQITGNSESQLTFAALGTAPAGGSGYRISMKANGGAVSAAGATTLTDGGSMGGSKAWQTNVLAGWSVRIVLGTGVGQTRTVQSNTATQLTVSKAWDVTPDTTSRYVVDKLPGVLTGAGGVNVAAWDSGSPTAWAETKTFAPAANSTTPIPDATTQWQVCFKCHSSANSSVTSWKSGWTDLATEFNPRNQSYHPVIAPAGAYAATGYGNTQLTVGTLTNGFKAGDVMYCSDCHGNNDTTYGASQGPHASAVSFILRGPNTRWPTQADGTTRFTISSRTAGQGTKDGLFCLNCHTLHTSGSHTSEHNSTACTACHILIPHGGKVKRLVRTLGTPAAYVDPGTTAVLRAYNGGTSSSSCSATCTTSHNATVTTTNSW